MTNPTKSSADRRDGATPDDGRDALVSGKADPGAAPAGEDETVLDGLGRSIGNIVLGSLPDPGPRDGVATGGTPGKSDDK